MSSLAIAEGVRQRGGTAGGLSLWAPASLAPALLSASVKWDDVRGGQAQSRTYRPWCGAGQGKGVE